MIKERVLGNLWVSKPRYMPGFGTPQILPKNEGFREGNLVKICKEVLNIAGFIEEFYYGNIDPQARSTKQNKKVQREMEVLMNTEEILTKELNDEHKKCFLDFANAWNVITLNPILIVSLWASASEQISLAMPLFQPNLRLRIC